MSLPTCEVDTILRALIGEHRKLLEQLDAQQAAMAALDIKAMEESARRQEQCRLRIAALETRRKQVVAQMARAMRMQPTATLSELAARDPQRGPGWLKGRDELKALLAQISRRAHIAGKLSATVLGHLNTVVRLLATAVDHAGLYTKTGVPQVARRIGVMEAVG
jgi:phosphoserine phosphatase